MCEILVDSFSLLNAALDDADMGILGSESGLSLGNAEMVHRVVDSLLRNDQIVSTVEGTGRQQTIPVRINGPHSAARADMAARLHKALQNPRKVTLVPCDGWGAEAWWRIQWASMEHVFDDFAARYNDYQDYRITLGVDAWAKSTETFTWTLTPSGTDAFIWDDIDLPGSAPFSGDISLTHGDVGCLVYTPGSIMADHPAYNPLSATLTDMPEGTYHLIVDVTNYTGGGNVLNWSVAGQSGQTDLTKLPYYAGGTLTGFVCLANDIYISPYTSTSALSVTAAAGSVTIEKKALLWVGNPMTGQSASYTMAGESAAGSTFTIHAPTPERPVPAQTFGGVQASTQLRAVGGEHRTDPGASKILALWAGATAPVGAQASGSGNPAFHTEVVPSSRW